MLVACNLRPVGLMSVVQDGDYTCEDISLISVCNLSNYLGTVFW